MTATNMLRAAALISVMLICEAHAVEHRAEERLLWQACDAIAKRANTVLYGGTSANNVVFSGILPYNNNAYNPPPFAIDTAKTERIYQWVKQHARPRSYHLMLENLIFGYLRPSDPEGLQIKAWCDAIMSGVFAVPESVGLTATSTVAEATNVLRFINPARDGWVRNGYENGDSGYRLNWMDTSHQWTPIRSFALAEESSQTAYTSNRWFISPARVKDRISTNPLWNNLYFVQTHMGNPYSTYAMLGNPSYSEYNYDVWDFGMYRATATGVFDSGEAYLEYQYTARPSWYSPWAFAAPLLIVGSVGLREVSADGLYSVAMQEQTREGASRAWSNLIGFLRRMRYIPLNAMYVTYGFSQYNQYSLTPSIVHGDYGPRGGLTNRPRVMADLERSNYGEFCAESYFHRTQRPGPEFHKYWRSHIPPPFTDIEWPYQAQPTPISLTTNVVPIASISGTRYPIDGDAIITICPQRNAPSGYGFRNIIDADGWVESSLTITQYLNDTSDMINASDYEWTWSQPTMPFSTANVVRTSDTKLDFMIKIEGYVRSLDPPTNSSWSKITMQWYLPLWFDWANAWAIMEYE